MTQAHALGIKRISGLWTKLQGEFGVPAPWLWLALGLGILVRAYFLFQPMRGDEAYTFLVFVERGTAALFDYSLPNNHVLNTLLIRLVTLVWGGSPAMIRLPAFAAGVAAIAVVYNLARVLTPYKTAGVLAATGMAIFPYQVLYSTNARGYSMVVLCALILVLAGCRFAGKPSAWGSAGLALVSALGMLAIPVMAFPIAGFFCWLVVLLWANSTPWRHIASRFVLPFAGLTALFTFLFYLPVIAVSHGIGPLVSNKFVVSQPWNDFLAQLGPQLQRSFEELVRDIPVVVLIFLAALLVVGMYAALKQQLLSAWLILPALLVGAAIVLFIQHRIPYARTWIYLIPFVLLAADAGLAFLLERLPGRATALFKTGLLACGLIFAARLMSANIIGAYPDTSAFPAAPIVVEYLKPILQPGDKVHITSTADWSVNYYFWANDIIRPAQVLKPGTGRTYYIVKKSRATIQSMTKEPVVKLMDMGDMALYLFQK